MNNKISKYIKISSICLLTSTSLIGCSLWSGSPPPRYNTVQGGRHAPALNPGGNGNIGSAFAVKVPPKKLDSVTAVPPARIISPPFIDGTTRKMLFSEDIKESGQVQSYLPIEPIVSVPVVSASNDKNVVNVKDSKKEQIKTLSKENPTQNIVNTKSTESKSAVKYMAGERLPSKMQDWTATKKDPIVSSKIPSYQTLSAPKSFELSSPSSAPTKLEVKPQQSDDVVVAAPVSPVVVSTPKIIPTSKIKNNTPPVGWKVIAPEVPKEVEGKKSVIKDRVIDESGSFKSAGYVDYPSDVVASKEYNVPEITLTLPKIYSPYRSGGMSESRYSKRLRDVRRSRSFRR